MAVYVLTLVYVKILKGLLGSDTGRKTSAIPRGGIIWKRLVKTVKRVHICCP